MQWRMMQWAAAAGVAILIGGAAHASIIDNMNDTSHFGTPFGSGVLVNNNDGTVTLTKTANGEGGAVWGDIGGADIALIPANDQLTVTPAGLLTPGSQYSANIVLFDSAKHYISQPGWIAYSTSTAPQTVSVSAFAQANGATNAAYYQVLFRPMPWNYTPAPNPGVIFDQISATAVPEPASLGLLGLGALGLIARRRRA